MKPLHPFSVTCIVLLPLICISSCETAQRTKSKLARPASESFSKNSCQRTANMPQKLRMDNYRAPTPDCVPRGNTLDTHELQQLIEQNPEPVLIDVLSVMARPNTEFGETKWIPNKERQSVPGSVWLPNVGYGQLDDEMQQYFKTQLNSLTRGNKHRPLVIFCIADCWMSWNAVQRAHEYGYTNIYWYKNGTDGWLQQGFKTQKIEPIPLAISE